MKKIGVIFNTKRAQPGSYLEELKQEAKHHNFQLFAEERCIADILECKHLPINYFGNEVDLVLAMGGDGTVLYAARSIHQFQIPIMGINLGSLGFLTGVADTEIKEAIQAIADNTCRLSKRDVAICKIYQNSTLLGEECALNDIVIGWGATSRIVSFGLTIDGDEVGKFMADGFMVSTPTGSTGHALSAGGPIVHPGIEGFSIAAICPHTLSTRPLVVPSSSKIDIDVINAAKELIVSLDGQDNFKIRKGDRIEIERSPYGVSFLKLPTYNYFSVLSTKLGWRGSNL